MSDEVHPRRVTRGRPCYNEHAPESLEKFLISVLTRARKNPLVDTVDDRPQKPDQGVQ
jgi:hypothetical protein